MKKLYILILRSYLGPLILTFFVALFLLLMQFLWKYIDDLVGKGLDWKVIAELMFYASSTFVPMALPLAILLSSIMTFGNLGENYELVAIKSSGISLQKVMKPLIVFTIFICGIAFLFSNYVMPVANLKMRSLLYDVRHLRPEISIKEGIFYNGIDGYSIRVAKKDKKKNMLYDILIYDQTDRDGNTNVAIADSGFMKITEDQKYMIFNLYDGYRYVEMKEDGVKKENRQFPHQKDIFKEQTIIFALEGFGFQRTDEDLFKDHFEMLNISQLNNAIDSLKAAYADRKKQFGVNILKSNYFRREIRLNPNDPTQKDLDTTLVLNTDSLFNGMNKTDKKKILDMAADFARTTKSYVNTVKQDISSRQEWITRHEIEWHRKFTLSFACFVLFFIGAPLGAIIRKGGIGMPVVISVVFFILYYIISISGEKAAREGVVSPLEGMWISSWILLPLGIFLTYKATTDSSLFNIDSYIFTLKRIFSFKWKKTHENPSALQ